jgi:molecular chaperone GrpE
MKRSENDPRSRKTGEKTDALAEEVSSMEGDTTMPEGLASDQEAGDDGSGAANARAVADEDRRFAEQHDKYLRLAAEYDNYRKRTARDSQLASQRGQGELLRGLLDAFDDLSRFAHVDPATTDTKTVVEGVALVERKVLKTLSALGLEVINPVDQSFDPATMEAVTTEPALSPEDDHVVSRVFQVGYRFNGQLLRPARVAVKQWNG